MNGQVLKSVKGIKENSNLDIKLSDGMIRTVVQKVEEEK